MVVHEAIREVPLVGTVLRAKDMATRPKSPKRPLISAGGVFALVAVAVLAVLGMNFFSILGLAIPGLPKASTTQTTTPPTIVVPKFTIDDTYQVMHETVPFSTSADQCRQFAIASCASGTLTAIARTNITISLVQNKDYNVVSRVNSYATAGKTGDVNLAITIWTRPSIADPDWDVNLITKSIVYQDTSSTLAGLFGTSVTQSQLEDQAQAEAVQFAQNDTSLFKAAQDQVIAKVSADAIAWGKDFGYTVHPTVVFGAKPGAER